MTHEVGKIAVGPAMRVCRRPMRWLVTVSMLAPFLGCTPMATVDPRTWSKSASAPAEFKFWAESERSISLPATEADFLEFVGAMGGEHTIVGLGASNTIPVPAPWPRSPCVKSDKAIMISFVSKNDNEAPAYTAYISGNAMIVCIDSQFAYVGP